MEAERKRKSAIERARERVSGRSVGRSLPSYATLRADSLSQSVGRSECNNPNKTYTYSAVWFVHATNRRCAAVCVVCGSASRRGHCCSDEPVTWLLLDLFIVLRRNVHFQWSRDFAAGFNLAVSHRKATNIYQTLNLLRRIPASFNPQPILHIKKVLSCKTASK